MSIDPGILHTKVKMRKQAIMNIMLYSSLNSLSKYFKVMLFNFNLFCLTKVINIKNINEIL